MPLQHCAIILCMGRVEEQSVLYANMSDNLPDFVAFISYAKADHSKAHEIVASLRGAGPNAGSHLAT